MSQKYHVEIMRKSLFHSELINFQEVSSNQKNILLKIFTPKNSFAATVFWILFPVFFWIVAIRGYMLNHQIGGIFTMLVVSLFILMIAISAKKLSKKLISSLESGDALIAQCIIYEPKMEKSYRQTVNGHRYTKIYSVFIKNLDGEDISDGNLIFNMNSSLIKNMIDNNIKEEKFWIIDDGNRNSYYLLSDSEYRSFDSLDVDNQN